jgi:hypothetical protein
LFLPPEGGLGTVRRVTPAQKKLPTPSEHAEQISVVTWANLMRCEFPKLRLLHAIPNGGHRMYGAAVKLMKEGVSRSVVSLKWEHLTASAFPEQTIGTLAGGAARASAT